VAGGLAVGGFGTRFNEASGVDDANNPAADVGDRTTTIKISKLTATPMQRKVLLKLETNHGVTGWGEIDQLEPYVAALLAKSLFELLDGENPTRIEHLWQKIYRSHRDMRGGPFMTHTLAGIDMALWDITGKLWGVPVYRLLGGPTRDKLRFYPTPNVTKVGAGPQPFSGTPQQIQEFVKSVENARKQVGPDGIVMFDARCVTTDLGATASLHCSAAVPLFLIHEYYPSISPPGLVTKNWSIDKEGYASLPQWVGLCCEIDEAKLAEIAKTPSKPEWPTRGRNPDGSIADY
jgi:L-alanine-DL-glutamate epimerase-like enolase superfamily enzyme